MSADEPTLKMVTALLLHTESKKPLPFKKSKVSNKTKHQIKNNLNASMSADERTIKMVPSAVELFQGIYCLGTLYGGEW
tara:strand:+ start:718 stop:954 length:237 start_codon:yes stop_codon:yes gene_type:complete